MLTNYNLGGSPEASQPTSTYHVIAGSNTTKKKLSRKFETLYLQFLEYKRPKLAAKSLHNYKAYWNSYFQIRFGKKDVQDITSEEFQLFINERLTTNKPGYVIKLLNALKTFYDYLVDFEHIGTNPLKKVNFPKYDNEKLFMLPESKISEIHHYILKIKDIRIRCMFMFLLHGRRINEVLTLKWSSINFETGHYEISSSESKSRKRLVFPLEKFMIKALQELEQTKRDDVYLFENRYTNEPFTYAWAYSKMRQFKKDLNVHQMTLHEFRHMLASVAVNNGVSLDLVAEMLGHNGLSSVKRYATLKLDAKSQAFHKAMRISLFPGNSGSI